MAADLSKKKNRHFPILWYLGYVVVAASEVSFVVQLAKLRLVVHGCSTGLLFLIRHKIVVI